jgi:hypothetical protein
MATKKHQINSVELHPPPCMQTGAGKTFTMSGDPRNYHHRGIIPRALHQIFREVDMRVDRIYTVQVRRGSNSYDRSNTAPTQEMFKAYHLSWHYQVQQ